MNDRAIRWLTLTICAALGAYGLVRLDLTNSITHFMPREHDAPLVELSLQLMDSPLAHRMVISIGGGPASAEVAAGLAEFLRPHPEVAWVESGLDEGAMRDLFELYFDRRMYLAADEPETEIPALLEPEMLVAQATRLRSRLARPDSMLVARMAPNDPLGLFDRIVDRVRATQPVAGGALDEASHPAEDHATILLGLSYSPFDFDHQVGLLEDIDREFERLEQASGQHLVMEQSGINRVAVASERKMKGEVNFISTTSICIVLALFLLVFRSLRHLFIALLTPLAGFVAALAITATTSTAMHGITLAFGFVLLGVAIDYPIHLMNHHAMSSPGSSARESIAGIRHSLISSGATTTLAFLALATSDFPGLREMGLFAAIGIPVSLTVTIFCLPAFLGESRAPSQAQRALSQGFERLVGWLEGHPLAPIAIFATFMTLAVSGLPATRWEDDPGQLMAADPEILAESERVRSRVADFDSGRFVVGLAPDPERALALNDRIHDRLEEGSRAGLLDGMMSMHSFIWSKSLQEANLAEFRAEPALGERIDEAFTRAGFRAGAFRPFDADLAQPKAAPLAPDDLIESPIARVMDSLFELDRGWAAVTYLRGVRSGDDLRALLADIEAAYYVDQGDIVGQIYQGFRESTTRMLGVGGLVVLVALVLRYRELARGLLAFLPPSLAALATFGLFGLLGIPVNVVSAVSLLVVLGMGVDYGIFSVDAAARPERMGATLSSLLISCLTSIFVFGVLALSEQTALNSLGLTVGVGTSFALALSPAVHVWARRLDARRQPGS